MVSSGGKRRIPIEDDDNDEQPVASSSAGSSAKRARFGDASKSSRTNSKTASASQNRRGGSDSSSPAAGGNDEDDDDDDVATPDPPASTSAAKNKKSKTASQRDDVEMDDENEEGDYTAAADDDEGNVDAAEEAAVQQGVDELRQKNQKGVVAEAGVVDTIVLKNFMCHKFLEVKLNPQINFIIGHNGSGKSVILTGLVFAFGTKASVTNRAKTLSDFVQKGASYCEVIVSLRNRGAEAYKPNTYGHTIYVTRRVNAEGGGGYKIADYQKKTVTTKRDELAAICDHFGIQMDNPVNILNQDMAKMFLHSQKPTDKYKFFLKGTQLAQLMEDYEKLYEQIQTIKSIVAVKAERVKELKDAQKQAGVAWQEIEATKNVETQITKFKNELAWVQVVEIEKDMNDAVKDQVTKQGRVNGYDQAIAAIKEQLQAAIAAVQEAETNREEMDNSAGDEEMAALKRKIDEANVKTRAVKAEQRQMINDLERLELQVRKCDADMDAAMKLMDSNTREKRERAQQKLDEINSQIQARSMEATTAKGQAAQFKMDADDKKRQMEAARNDQEAAQQTLAQSEAIIRGIESRRSNAMNAFGPQAVAILNAIDRERSWHEKPLGPVGRYVKLKDPNYSKLCESLFGDMLNSFIVTSESDRQRLNALIRNHRGARHNVHFVQWDDRFESQYMKDVPDRQFTTLHDILTIEHKYVLKLLVDVTKIESSILVRERPEGDRIMRAKPANVTGCLSADCYRLGGLGEGARMIALNEWKWAPRLTKDVEGDLRAAHQQRQEAETRLQEINQTYRAMEREVGELYAQSRRSQAESERASRQIPALNHRAEDLAEEAKERQPPSVQAIQTNKDETLDEIKNIKAQKAAAEEQIKEYQAPVANYKRALADCQNLQEQRRMIQQNQYEEIEKLVTKKVELESHLNQRKASRNGAREAYDEATRVAEGYAVRLEEAIAQASDICPREDVTLDGKKSRAKYEKTIASLEKALREKEQSLGGRSEEIYQRFVKAKQDYEDARDLVRDLKLTVKSLTKAHEKRVDRWALFRDLITTRARMLFLYYLSTRGFSGELRFKHMEQKLELRVRTDDDGSTQATQKPAKDVSTLSGGEKSFSTICLLLSLWAAAGCPIRGLDEYDVYMDAVNRKIATNMLIAAGQACNNTQMILITPQALLGFANMPGVKLIRIADPERGQGILAAES